MVFYRCFNQPSMHADGGGEKKRSQEITAESYGSPEEDILDARRYQRG